MPRQTDLNEIPTERRTFIKNDEWQVGDTRNFYYAGYEKVEKTSKIGNPYTQYLFYLIPINDDGSIGEEVTLPIFPNQAGEFKQNVGELYQEIKVTKTAGERGEDYKVLGIKNVLPKEQRPEVKDYPELRSGNGESKPKMEVPSNGRPEEGEINIDDIPF